MSDPTLHDFSAKTIDGEERSLADFRGKAVLVVNVASKCGLTPHYKGLQELYDEYSSAGLEILGFPCNQFGAQEPGSDSEVKEFCSTNYGVTFPMFSKIEVNGDGRDPLYAWLTAQGAGPEEAGDIKWNFTKFLVGKDGRVVARFAPPTEPGANEVRNAIGEALS
ncbi:MAG: glutathione peroxidase [Myxococcota bacterium]|nr:glutathione peroxidase [Myxococcota bacterium]